MYFHKISTKINMGRGNYNDSIRDMLGDIHFKLKFVNFLAFYAFLS